MPYIEDIIVKPVYNSTLKHLISKVKMTQKPLQMTMKLSVSDEIIPESSKNPKKQKLAQSEVSTVASPDSLPWNMGTRDEQSFLS